MLLNLNTITIDFLFETPNFPVLISLEIHLSIPLIIFKWNHKVSIIKSIYAAIVPASQERGGEFLINVNI